MMASALVTYTEEIRDCSRRAASNTYGPKGTHFWVRRAANDAKVVAKALSKQYEQH